MRRREAGFTLLEILIVVAILGILLNIAVPGYIEAVNRSRAMSVVADFNNVRRAVSEYAVDKGEYPSDYWPGSMPPDLGPYLGNSVRWHREDLDVRYDWDNWVRWDGEPKHPATGVLHGFSLITQNDTLIKNIQRYYDGDFRNTLGRNYTFVITPIP
jgi:prepilin-type N-terminal cleavage/methylation domain-containing protein